MASSTEEVREGPWFVESAVRWLNKEGWLGRVFEFGSGTSTPWIGAMSDVLVSVENDREYFHTVKEMVADMPQVDIIFAARPYNGIIDTFSDGYFDLVIVDGRDRVKCIESAIPKIARGGYLLLDNSEREEYQSAVELLSSWNRIDFKQITPDKYGFTYEGWMTTVFQKP